MPGGIFTGGFGTIKDQGTNAAASTGTTLTPGSANIKGSYAQLVASTSNDASGFLLVLSDNTEGNGATVIDIAVGAAGSEKIILPNILYGHGAQYAASAIFVPIAIPAGSRVAARCQTFSGAGTVTAQITLMDGNHGEVAPCAAAQSYGVDLTTTRGTAVTSGAANTKGSWTQIVSATTYDIAALQVVLDHRLENYTGQFALLDIGIGASGSEQVIVPNLQHTTSWSNATIHAAMPPVIRKKIPAGSRVAVRFQNALASQTLGFSFIGYPQ